MLSSAFIYTLVFSGSGIIVSCFLHAFASCVVLISIADNVNVKFGGVRVFIIF